jgi:alpha-galactosidase
MASYNIHKLLLNIQIMKKILALLFIFYFLSMRVNGFEISYNSVSNEFILQNDLFVRVLKNDMTNNAFYTTSFKNLITGNEYCKGDPYFIEPTTSDEFSFTINGKVVTGGMKSRLFEYVNHEITIQSKDTKNLKVWLKGFKESDADQVLVILNYEIYADLPLVRKWIEIQNVGDNDITISDLAWEQINLIPSRLYMAEVYADYGRNVKRFPFTGGPEDPAVLVYNPDVGEGFIVGNEAPGWLKRIEVYTKAPVVSVMMNPGHSHMPFKRTLSTGTSYKSPKSFIHLYNGDKWQDAYEGTFQKFLRNYLGVKLFERENTPVFFYNTWEPFRMDINEKMIYEIADALVETGAEYLIIDEGWQDLRGDWNPHPTKFPNGLKPVTDYIRSKGMKPGIWIALTDVAVESEAYKQYSDLVVLDKEGEKANLHSSQNEFRTMSLNTIWYDVMMEKTSNLIEVSGVEYLKIDLASVKSAYIFDEERAGDYANDRGYADQKESIAILYERIIEFIDELKAKFPHLYVDCTFELWGYMHIVDYSLIKHSDGDWLSNITADPPGGAITIRQLAHDRARVIPVSTMLVGNPMLDAPNHQFAFLSMLSITPITLGDPRLLTAEQKRWYKNMYTWYRAMEDKYQISQFYQLSDVFERPSHSNWDGSARFNQEKNGGILCFYRNGSADKTRTFKIPWVDPNSVYSLYSPVTRKRIKKISGKHLIEKGLSVTIENEFSAEIFSVEEIK